MKLKFEDRTSPKGKFVIPELEVLIKKVAFLEEEVKILKELINKK